MKKGLLILGLMPVPVVRAAPAGDHGCPRLTREETAALAASVNGFPVGLLRHHWGDYLGLHQFNGTSRSIPISCSTQLRYLPPVFAAAGQFLQRDRDFCCRNLRSIQVCFCPQVWNENSAARQRLFQSPRLKATCRTYSGKDRSFALRIDRRVRRHFPVDEDFPGWEGVQCRFC